MPGWNRRGGSGRQGTSAPRAACCGVFPHTSSLLNFLHPFLQAPPRTRARPAPAPRACTPSAFHPPPASRPVPPSHPLPLLPFPSVPLRLHFLNNYVCNPPLLPSLLQTLYCSSMPPESAARVLDALFHEGAKVAGKGGKRGGGGGESATSVRGEGLYVPGQTNSNQGGREEGGIPAGLKRQPGRTRCADTRTYLVYCNSSDVCPICSEQILFRVALALLKSAEAALLKTDNAGGWARSRRMGGRAGRGHCSSVRCHGGEQLMIALLHCFTQFTHFHFMHLFIT